MARSSRSRVSVPPEARNSALYTCSLRASITGKTTFTRGLARGLGIPGPVTSPTYTLVNEYTCGAVPLFHFDMYRLNNAGELFDIGWEDYLDRGGICVVEWSERVADALENCVTVTIEPVSGAACRRKITIEGVEQDADSGL